MANEFIARNGIISKSNLVVSGSLTALSTITAQTLVVQTITSSISSITGSTNFGSIIGNTHTFTGSLNVTGALAVTTNGVEFQVNSTGVNLGNTLTDSHIISGSLTVNPGGLFVSGSGNVGINTTSPSSKLHVVGSSLTDTFRITDASNYTIVMGYSGSANVGMISTLGGTAKLALGTNSAARLTIDGTGNVGIGTVSPSQLFEVVGGEIKAGRVDSSNEGGQVSFGRSTDNATAWYIDAYGNTASPQLRFVNVTNAVVAMTLTGSNVGVGTSSPDIFGRGDAMNVGISATGASDNMSLQLNAGGSGGRGAQIYMGQGGTRHFTISSNVSETRVGTVSSTPLIFESAGTERMRITSGGYLKANNTGTYPYSTTNVHEIGSNVSDNTIIINNSSAIPSGIFLYYNQAPNGNSNYFYNAYDGNIATKRFAVRSNGGIENYQANDLNLSDERTKKEISLLESYWDKFKAIEIVKFKYKDQTHDDFNIGLIAQQVEEVAPEFIDIDGWDNGKPKIKGQEEIISTEEPMKSIYTADLYHAAIKVLQEAMAKIETLEARIQELENK